MFALRAAKAVKSLKMLKKHRCQSDWVRSCLDDIAWDVTIAALSNGNLRSFVVSRHAPVSLKMIHFLFQSIFTPRSPDLLIRKSGLRLAVVTSSSSLPNEDYCANEMKWMRWMLDQGLDQSLFGVFYPLISSPSAFNVAPVESCTNHVSVLE